MKNECSIVRDILPLYVEGVVSKETAVFAAGHIARCEICREAAKRMETPPLLLPPQSDAAPLRKIKRRLLIHRVQTAALAVTVAAVLGVALFSYLTAPQYFPYTPDLLSVTEDGAGTVTVAFDERVSGYTLYELLSPDDGGKICSIEAWTTVWDSLFQDRGTPNVLIRNDGAASFAVYYIQNYFHDGMSAENVFLWGDPARPSGGMVSLPGLSLWYLLLLAVGALAVLGIAWLVCRDRQRARTWIGKAMLLPVSYLIGHVCVLGTADLSYSPQRDMSLIMAAAVLVCCGLLLSVHIYTAKKEAEKTQGCR